MTVDDVPSLSDAISKNAEHLRPWMSWVVHEPLSEDARISMIEGWNASWARGGDSLFGLFLDGVLVGGLGLHRRVAPGGIEIGYWLDVDHLGRGLMTEAVAGAIEAVFATPAIERVEIHHDKANEASAGIPRRLAFTLVEESPQEVAAPGQVGVEWRWVVTRTDWRLGRPS